MCALIDACDSDTATVGLFEDSVKASCLLLWSQQKPEAKIFGCQILASFAKKQNVDDLAAPIALSQYVEPLTNLIRFEHPDAEIQRQVRVEALQALKQVVFVIEKDVVDHLQGIVPALLGNISEFKLEDVKEEIEDINSVEYLSQSCYRHVCQIMDLVNINTILQYVFEFLDSRRWENLEYNSAAIRMISQNIYNISAWLFQQTETSSQRYSVSVLKTLADVVLRTKRSLGPFQGSIRSLIKKCQSLFDSSSNLSIAVGDLQDSMISIISAYCARMQNVRDQLRLIENLCILEREHTKNSHVTEALLGSILKASQLRRGFNERESDALIGMVHNPLLHIVEVNESLSFSTQTPIFRSRSLQSICNVLVETEYKVHVDEKPQLEAILTNAEGKVPRLVWRVFQNDWSVLSKCPLLNSDINVLLRQFVFRDLVMANRPASQWHYYLLCLMFYFNPVSEMLGTLPMVLRFLDLPESRDDLYVFTVGYLWFLVHFLDSVKSVFSMDSSVVCAELEDYIRPFFEDISSNSPFQNWFTSRLSLTFDGAGWTAKNRIDRQQVVSIIARLQFSNVQPNAPNLAQVLFAKWADPVMQWYQSVLDRVRRLDDKEDSKSYSMSALPSGPALVTRDTIDASVSPVRSPLRATSDGDEMASSPERKGTIFTIESSDQDFHSLASKVEGSTAKRDHLRSKVLQTSFSGDDSNIIGATAVESHYRDGSMDPEDEEKQDLDEDAKRTILGDLDEEEPADGTGRDSQGNSQRNTIKKRFPKLTGDDE
eukprot:TRINITY_DN7914_c0_g1_i1.p1 TRINITY_DN7914_c0_g1~~TRINITY_DN7914_c0_g1_i1.p1  ORF type:complete len:855 (-),score=169.55 TRINITY_DN7914_c0_g1_i1:942-3251(-)